MRILALVLLLSNITFAQNEEFKVLGYECGDCHGSSGWTDLTLTGFDHSKTVFPLKDVHQMQPCTACHSGNTVQEKHNFSLAESGCNNCHIDVHGSELGSDCEQCHSNRSWQVTRQTFDHEMTRFSLLGAHNNVLCEKCHTEKPMVQFRNLTSECYECHQSDYASVSTPSHVLAKIDRDCQVCHPASNKKWLPAVFNHEEYYSLTGSHRTIDCYNCHEGLFRGTATDCRTCHIIEYNATGTATYPDAPRHALSEFFAEQCEDCHTTTNWLPVDFDHIITGYPIEGRHVEVTCDQCHGGDQGYDIPDDCHGCHQPGGIAITTILDGDYDHTTHNLPAECELCHTTLNWDQSLFQHESFLSNLCEDCHLIDHAESSEPPHGNENISTDCLLCHEAGNEWIIPVFSHFEAQTRYPLLGLHALVDCELCHQNNIYNTTPNTCQDNQCHISQYNDVANPDHVSNSYPIEYCNICHSEMGWTPSLFSHILFDACVTCHLPDYNGANDPVHDPARGFIQTCEICHNSTDTWDGAFIDHSKVNDPCVSCHLMDHIESIDPPHSNNNISTDCILCHDSGNTWDIPSFPHLDTQTRYALLGSHLSIDCELCHQNNIYNTTPNTCQDNQCHINHYNTTANPNHISYSYPIEYCDICHTELGWAPSLFSHNTSDVCVTCHLPDYSAATDPIHDPSAGFTQTCENCHASTETWDGAFLDHSKVNDPCVSCHLMNHIESIDPPHDNGNISTDCILCHESGDTWDIQPFSHLDSQTEYALFGLHVLVGCESCHQNNIYNTTPNTCQDNQCHVTHFNEADEPNHILYTYPIQYCDICHDELGWAPSIFSHNASDACVTCHLPDYSAATAPVHEPNAGYSQTCENCHTNTSTWVGAFLDHTGLTDCVSCHLADYQGTTNPNHVEKSYSQDCMECHQSTEDWLLVEIDHSNYNGPCATCHLNDFNSVTDPNHVDNEFSNECELCHLSTSVWRTDEYPHTVEIPCLVCNQSEYDNTTEPDHPTNQFDSDCMICHISNDTWIIGEYPHSLTEIACAACHMPEYTATVDPNHVENNYNLDCTTCHNSTTDWNNVTFNHTGITGEQCWNCHAGDFVGVSDPNHEANNYDHNCFVCHNSTTDWNNVTFNHTGITGDQCWNCHAGDFIGVSDPDHVTNDYDHDCTTCHNSTTDWEGVTFNHDGITGEQCINCHLGDYLDVTNPNHNAQGYPEDCTLCHNTVNWEDEFFNHLFPIYSGDHNNEWSTCTAECHINPADYVDFSCGLYGVCHDHRQSEMDDEHIGEVNGYVYESGACYECHPNGTEDDDGDDDRRRPPKAKDWRNILKNNRF